MKYSVNENAVPPTLRITGSLAEYGVSLRAASRFARIIPIRCFLHSSKVFVPDVNAHIRKRRLSEDREIRAFFNQSGRHPYQSGRLPSYVPKSEIEKID